MHNLGLCEHRPSHGPKSCYPKCKAEEDKGCPLLQKTNYCPERANKMGKRYIISSKANQQT